MFLQRFVVLFNDWNFAAGANGQNQYFAHILSFIILRGDLNICGCETDGKWTGLSCSSMDVLPSRSSSRSRDWKLCIALLQEQYIWIIWYYRTAYGNCSIACVCLQRQFFLFVSVYSILDQFIQKSNNYNWTRFPNTATMLMTSWFYFIFAKIRQIKTTLSQF